MTCSCTRFGDRSFAAHFGMVQAVVKGLRRAYERGDGGTVASRLVQLEEITSCWYVNGEGSA